MKILVTNDDGYLAYGIKLLANKLKRFGDVVVIAPDGNRSTISHVDGYNYFFTAKIKITLESNYNTYYCAAPFIVIDDEYYFLPQMEASVSNIAWSEYYGYTSNTTFSKAALHILIGI